MRQAFPTQLASKRGLKPLAEKKCTLWSNRAHPHDSVVRCRFSFRRERTCLVAEAEHEHVDQRAAGMPPAGPLEDDRAGDVPVAPHRFRHGRLGEGLASIRSAFNTTFQGADTYILIVNGARRRHRGRDLGQVSAFANTHSRDDGQFSPEGRWNAVALGNI